MILLTLHKYVARPVKNIYLVQDFVYKMTHYIYTFLIYTLVIVTDQSSILQSLSDEQPKSHDHKRFHGSELFTFTSCKCGFTCSTYLYSHIFFHLYINVLSFSLPSVFSSFIVCLMYLIYQQSKNLLCKHVNRDAITFN